MPDAINQLAFRLFDVESKGRITFGEGERRRERGRGWLVIWKVQVLGEGKVITFGQFSKTWSKLLPTSYAALLYLIRELQTSVERDVHSQECAF